jgi:heme exporter protein A
VQLIVESLSQSRGGRRILEALSFEVAGGEALLLTGPNGAGKTTLMRTLAGFLKPEAGDVRLEGGDLDLAVAEQCHFIGHLNGLKASLTVGENLSFWASYLGGNPLTQDRVARGLDAFQIGHLASIPTGYLSAGQKRRAALARLLVAERPLWLLDEPTSSLDARSSELVRDAIESHLAQGGLAVVATHMPLGLRAARELKLGGAA